MASAREDNLVSCSAAVVRDEDILFAVRRYRAPEGGKVLLPWIPEAHFLRMWPYLHGQSEHPPLGFCACLCALACSTGEDVRRASHSICGTYSSRA